jgi:hypothetical protein
MVPLSSGASNASIEIVCFLSRRDETSTKSQSIHVQSHNGGLAVCGMELSCVSVQCARTNCEILNDYSDWVGHV